jgi:hypothetical protein
VLRSRLVKSLINSVLLSAPWREANYVDTDILCAITAKQD